MIKAPFKTPQFPHETGICRATKFESENHIANVVGKPSRHAHIFFKKQGGNSQTLPSPSCVRRRNAIITKNVRYITK